MVHTVFAENSDRVGTTTWEQRESRPYLPHFSTTSQVSSSYFPFKSSQHAPFFVSLFQTAKQKIMSFRSPWHWNHPVQPCFPKTNKIISMQFPCAFLSDLGSMWTCHLGDTCTLEQHWGSSPSDVANKLTCSFVKSNWVKQLHHFSLALHSTVYKKILSAFSHASNFKEAKRTIVLMWKVPNLGNPYNSGSWVLHHECGSRPHHPIIYLTPSLSPRTDHSSTFSVLFLYILFDGQKVMETFHLLAHSPDNHK